jgi:tRNA modification GTPase
LFNLLLKRERAIVSDEEGTTRDIISEWADVNGHPIKILDTAGIRKTQSKAEKIGISMLNENLKSASLILFVYDIEKGLSEEEKSEIERMKDTPMVIAANKIDRAKRKKAEKEHIMISALTGEGIEKLEEAITEKLHFNEKIEITVNDRQMHIIERMCSVLLSDEISVIIKESEILDERVGELLKEIRELTGEILSENVMDNIFNNFCIGK